MVTKSEAFPAKWLKPPDLKGQPVVLEIKNAVQEAIKFNGKEAAPAPASDLDDNIPF